MFLNVGYIAPGGDGALEGAIIRQSAIGVGGVDFLPESKGTILSKLLACRPNSSVLRFINFLQLCILCTHC